jgi:multidrug resistance efflux pump
VASVKFLWSCKTNLPKSDSINISMEHPRNSSEQSGVTPRTDRVPIPLREHWRDVRNRVLPLVVWLAGVAGVYTLWMQQPVAPSFYGLAQTTRMEVSTPVAGLLTEVLVELHQDVSEGQLIAALDPVGHQAALETANAELDRLSSEVDAEMARILASSQTAQARFDARQRENLAEAALDRPARMRRFRADESDLEVQALRAELSIAVDLLEADRIEVRLKRAESLALDEAGPESDVVDLGLERQQVLEQVERSRDVLARLQTEITDAVARRVEFEGLELETPDPNTVDLDLDGQLAGLRAAIVVQRRRLQELEIGRQSLFMRATREGQVAALPAQPGQALLAGEAVAVLVDPRPAHVLLYVPETQGQFLARGDKFSVARAPVSDQPITLAVDAWIESAAPAIEQIPARLWRDPRYPEFGRAYLIGPVTELNLVPGERVVLDPQP